MLNVRKLTATRSSACLRTSLSCRPGLHLFRFFRRSTSSRRSTVFLLSTYPTSSSHGDIDSMPSSPRCPRDKMGTPGPPSGRKVTRVIGVQSGNAVDGLDVGIFDFWLNEHQFVGSNVPSPNSVASSRNAQSPPSVSQSPVSYGTGISVGSSDSSKKEKTPGTLYGARNSFKVAGARNSFKVGGEQHLQVAEGWWRTTSSIDESRHRLK